MGALGWWLVDTGDRSVELSEIRPSAHVVEQEKRAASEGERGAIGVDASLEFDEQDPVPDATGPAGRIFGEVVDVSGAPLPEAVIRFESDGSGPREVPTDGFGRFEASPVRGEYELEPYKENYIAITHAEGELEMGEILEGVRLILAPARNLTGLVLDQEGQPVGDARISIDLDTGGAQQGLSAFGIESVGTRTSEDGRFQIASLPTYPVELYAGHPLHVSQEQVLSAEQTDVRIILGPQHRPATIIGTVMAPDGTLVVGASVKLQSTIRSPRTTTDRNGRFRGSLFAPQDEALAHDVKPLQVFVYAKGYAVHHQLHPPIEPGITKLEVRLRHSLTLRGIVLDADGLAVPYATLWLDCEEELWPGNTLLQAADLKWMTANDAGAFSFPDLWDTEFKLRVLVPGHGGIQAEAFARAGREDLVIRLGEGLANKVRFAVRVFDETSGTPLEDVHFRTYGMPVGTRGSTAYRLDDGRFEILVGDPGQWAIVVEAGGYAPWFDSMSERAAGLHELEAHLLRGRAFQVRVFDGTGAPVSGAKVQPLSLEGRPIAFEEDIPLGGIPNPLETGPGGHLRFTLLPRTVLILEVTLPDGTQSRQRFDLTGEEPQTAEIHF